MSYNIKMKRQITESKGKVKKAKKYLSENKLKDIVAIFLSDKKQANIVVDLLDQFHKPSETPTAYVNALENIFVKVLKRQDMVIADNTNDVEKQYKDWLSERYEDALNKLYLCHQKGSPECSLQALNTLFKLLSIEAKYPIISKKKKKFKKKNVTVVVRLKDILKSSSLSSNLSAEVLKRWSEYAEYKDVHYNLWLAVDSLLQEICQKQPINKHIWNILLILSKLPKIKKVSDIVLCEGKNVVPEERTVKLATESVWKLLAKWQYSPATQQLLLVVLVEQIMPGMDNAIYLTDYFMDALAKDECELNMLALQGIFNLVIKHNIEYPDIFGKLYHMFTVNALQAKYKTRLFALADEFLRSTHLPLALVAAFAKRFSRLLFLASPPDAVILLTFIANLLIRHPNLQFLCHNPDGKEVDDDPYLETEKDPLKSRAMESQLWEVRLLQQHYSEKVAKMAAVFNNDLPSVEYELEPLLERTWMEMVKKDLQILKKKIPQVAEKFEDKPLSSKLLEARRKEDELIWDTCDIKKLFIIEQ